jgi:hypothetical protein
VTTRIEECGTKGTGEAPGRGVEGDADVLGGWGIGGIPLDLVGGLVAWS